MSYPSAPWQLFGTAVQATYLIDTAIAKRYLPSDLELVSVFPGKTLASVYLSKYDERSTLQYHELIVAPGLVKYRDKIGAWISHIYVDNLDSVAGGRNIWGLPKQMADFSWSDEQISVVCDDLPLCSVEISSRGLPLSPFGKSKIGGDVFGGLERDILLFKGDFTAWLKWIDFRLHIEPASPLAAVNFGLPLLSLKLSDLEFTANEATIIGRSSTDLRTFAYAPTTY